MSRRSKPGAQLAAPVITIAALALSCSSCRTSNGAASGPGASDTTLTSSGGRAERHAEPPEAEDDGHAVILGRIDPKDVTSVTNARIAVYSIGDRGVLEPISSAEVQSDGDGKFEIAVALPIDGPHDLLVTAERKGFSGRGSALVPSWAVVDGMIVAPPISVETAVESDVFLAALRSGAWRPHLGSGELRTFVSPRLAARLRASDHYDEDVLAVAKAATAAIEAWYQALLRPEIGLDVPHLRTLLEAVAWAQVALDAELYAAATDEDLEQAHEIHEVVVRGAYGSVGIGPEQLATAAQVTADTLRGFVATLTPPSRCVMVADIEAFRARHITWAINALFDRSGADEEERSVVRDAGELLEGRILSAGVPRSASEAQIDGSVKSAWKEYRSVVQARLHPLKEQAPDVPPAPDEEEPPKHGKEDII